MWVAICFLGLFPLSVHPADFVHAIEPRIERREIEPEDAGGFLPDTLGDFVTVQAKGGRQLGNWQGLQSLGTSGVDMYGSLKAESLMFFAFVAVLLTLQSYCTAAAPQSTEGDSWLRMSQDTRTGFVWGYTIGLSRGFAQGCDAYRSVEEPEKSKSYDLRSDPFAKCLNSRGRGFSRRVDFYVKQMTDFYQSFPSDRAVPFEEVLKRLSDSEDMTPKQMHEWFGQRKTANPRTDEK